jgi:hypothetical protein
MSNERIEQISSLNIDELVARIIYQLNIQDVEVEGENKTRSFTNDEVIYEITENDNGFEVARYYDENIIIINKYDIYGNLISSERIRGESTNVNNEID